MIISALGHVFYQELHLYLIQVECKLLHGSPIPDQTIQKLSVHQPVILNQLTGGRICNETAVEPEKTLSLLILAHI